MKRRVIADNPKKYDWDKLMANKGLVHKWFIDHNVFDPDERQLLWIEAARAAKRRKPRRGTFATYLYACLRAQTYSSTFRQRAVGKPWRDSEIVYDTMPAVDAIDPRETPEDVSVRVGLTRAIYKNLDEISNEIGSKIIKSIFGFGQAPKTLREIGGELRCHAQTVRARAFGMIRPMRNGPKKLRIIDYYND